jgi:hypothetical protein
MIAGHFLQLQNDEKTKILPNGTLIVNAVNHEDEGWYTCTAKNKGKQFTPFIMNKDCTDFVWGVSVSGY